MTMTTEEKVKAYLLRAEAEKEAAINACDWEEQVYALLAMMDAEQDKETLHRVHNILARRILANQYE